MENYSTKLLELAKQVTTIYKDWEGIKAIAITSSISRNQATEYSDCDIALMYDKLPSDDFLEKAYKYNNGKNRKVFSKTEDAIVEFYYVNGVECQFSHSHYSFYEQVVTELTENYSLEKIYHLVADGLQVIIPLHGKEYLNSIQERLAPYPEELALKTVQRYLRFGPFDELRYRFQKEDNFIWISDVTNYYIKTLLNVLLGVNNKYIPGDFRKIKPVIEGLTTKPDNFYQRIFALYNGNSIDKIDELHKLCLEVFEIVANRFPNEDFSDIISRFNEPHPHHTF
jgi:predicted nucleotidyltransferase